MMNFFLIDNLNENRFKSIKPMYILCICMTTILIATSCKESPDTSVTDTILTDEFDEILTDNDHLIEASTIRSLDYDTSLWYELTERDGFLIDIKYAGNDNFMKTKIYDCGRCFLRPEVAKSLIAAKKQLQKNTGYTFRLFDCYRPKPYQQKLWDVMPDTRYVAHPSKGSMHSRGLAIDLTISHQNGIDLDMGTGYDDLSKASHTDVPHPDKQAEANRVLLKSIMEEYGFKGIRTEWWHFSGEAKNASFSDWLWPCE
jgi:zinc D-Ala-D-Ala dipeptidase